MPWHIRYNQEIMFLKGLIYEVDFKVSETVYGGFTALFGDKNPLHTEEQFAIEKGFRSKVMHGNILGGFLSYFVGECLPTKNVIIHSQEIKYTKPIYLNDELLLKVIVNEVYNSVNAIEFKYNFVNKDSMLIVAKGKIQIGLLL